MCGSTQGIGRACAHALATLGAAVTLVARDAEALERVRGELPAAASGEHEAVVADFSRPAEVARAAAAIAKRGPAHVLVHNTGGPPAGPLTDASADALTSAFAMHVVCGQHLVQALVPGMRAAGYGRIVNVISTSVKAPIPGLGVSNTIRGAVASWAKTLAGELGPDGITVNNVLPGFTSTARLRSLLERTAELEGVGVDEIVRRKQADIPLRRFAEPAEIAAAVAFLASPAAAYISGINLPVDGGRLPVL